MNLKEKAGTWRMILLRKIQKEFQGGPERFLRLLGTHKVSRPLYPEGLGADILPISIISAPRPSPDIGRTESAAHLEAVESTRKGIPAHVQKQDRRLFKILSNIALKIICTACKWNVNVILSNKIPSGVWPLISYKAEQNRT